MSEFVKAESLMSREELILEIERLKVQLTTPTAPQSDQPLGTCRYESEPHPKYELKNARQLSHACVDWKAGDRPAQGEPRGAIKTWWCQMCQRDHSICYPLSEVLAAPASQPERGRVADELVHHMRGFAEECLRRIAVNPGRDEIRVDGYELHTKQTYTDIIRLCDRVVPPSQPVAPEEITDMRMCEIHRLTLHENQLYRFTAAPGCQKCADYLNPNGATPSSGADTNEVVAPTSEHAIAPATVKEGIESVASSGADARELIEQLSELIYHETEETFGGTKRCNFWLEKEPAAALLESFRAETLARAMELTVKWRKPLDFGGDPKAEWQYRTLVREMMYTCADELEEALGSDPNWLARQIAKASLDGADFVLRSDSHAISRYRNGLKSQLAALESTNSKLAPTSKKE